MASPFWRSLLGADLLLQSPTSRTRKMPRSEEGRQEIIEILELKDEVRLNQPVINYQRSKLMYVQIRARAGTGTGGR